jgi:hypothetical protein
MSLNSQLQYSFVAANFYYVLLRFQFENEMIAKLDILVEGGRGDEQYKELFGEIMLERCENHSTMKDQVRCVSCSCHNHWLQQHPQKFPS